MPQRSYLTLNPIFVAIESMRVRLQHAKVLIEHIGTIKIRWCWCNAHIWVGGITLGLCLCRLNHQQNDRRDENQESIPKLFDLMFPQVCEVIVLDRTAALELALIVPAIIPNRFNNSAIGSPFDAADVCIKIWVEPAMPNGKENYGAHWHCHQHKSFRAEFSQFHLLHPIA